MISTHDPKTVDRSDLTRSDGGRKETAMDCLRCHGMMVQDWFEDTRADPLDMSFYGLRCVCCGNILDPVIAANRSRQLLAPDHETAPHLLIAEAVENWDIDIEAA